MAETRSDSIWLNGKPGLKIIIPGCLLSPTLKIPRNFWNHTTETMAWNPKPPFNDLLRSKRILNHQEEGHSREREDLDGQEKARNGDGDALSLGFFTHEGFPGFYRGSRESHSNHWKKVQDQERFIAGGPATGISNKQTPIPTNSQFPKQERQTPAPFRTWWRIGQHSPESAHLSTGHSHAMIMSVLRMLRGASEELTTAMYASRKARTSEVRSRTAMSIALSALEAPVVDCLAISAVSSVMRSMPWR